MEKISSSLKWERDNMIRLVVGQLISLFGTQIYTFALSYYILKTTGSGIYFGISLALGMLPQFLFSSVAGVLCDQFSRKKLIVMTDMISGGVLIGMFIIALSTGFRITFIYILMFVLASLNSFNSVALSSAVPNIVSKNKVVDLNSTTQSASSLARITAPFIGGIIIASVDMTLFLLINGISFLIAAWLESGIAFITDVSRDDKSIKKKKISFFADFSEGWDYCKSNRIIYILILFMIVMNFLFHFAYTVPVPLIINTTLSMNSTQFGVIQALTSGGAFFTSAVLMSRLKKVKINKLLVLSITGMSIILITVGATTLLSQRLTNEIIVYIIFIILNFLFGGTIVVSNISIMTLLQIKAEEAFRGRVMGISNMTRCIISPLAVLLAGIIIDRIDSYIVPLVGGSALLLSVIVLNSRKEIKQVEL